MPAVRLALERHVIEQIGQKADRQRAYEANWQSNLVPPDIYQHFRYAAYYTGVPASRDLNTWLKQ